MAKLYQDMTLEELELENQKLMEQKSKIKAEQHLVMAEMNKKLTLASAQRKVATLSDAEKAALRQIISVEDGIPSSEGHSKRPGR